VRSAAAIEILFPDSDASFAAFRFIVPALKGWRTSDRLIHRNIARLLRKHWIFIMLVGLVIMIQCAACVLCSAKKLRKANKEFATPQAATAGGQEQE
jgi:hypothetical protein